MASGRDLSREPVSIRGSSREARFCSQEDLAASAGCACEVLSSGARNAGWLSRRSDGASVDGLPTVSSVGEATAGAGCTGAAAAGAGSAGTAGGAAVRSGTGILTAECGVRPEELVQSVMGDISSEYW